MTGTTPETASRVMSQFQKDGLIRTGRQWVAISDQVVLEQIAGLEI
ncbi:MAG: helix-turn-helix domain-containing protein [Anaerolineales bacterium]